MEVGEGLKSIPDVPQINILVLIMPNKVSIDLRKNICIFLKNVHIFLKDVRGLRNQL